MRILLVEDNPVDRMFVTQSLRQVEGFGHELHACESMMEALQQLGERAFDVILLDLWLPDSEGLDTCDRIITHSPNIPIVVMTGTDDHGMASDAMRRGAQEFMVKGSFPGTAIARVLQYAIDRHQFARQITSQDIHFRQVMNHVPALVWTTDRESKITSMFGAELQQNGISLPQGAGKSVAEYFGAMRNTGRLVNAHQTTSEVRSQSLEFEWEERNYHVSLDSLKTADADVMGMIGVAIDVTEKRILDREMHFARVVQESLLPAEHPKLDGFDIYGASFPARQTCGDWFDYLTFPDDSVGLTVGDICGKGFGQAIQSATIAAYLEVLAESCSNLQEMLNFCNRLVCRQKRPGRKFAVLALARLQLAPARLTYAGAGEQLLVVSRDGHLKHTIPASGIPIGLMDNVRYDAPAEVSLDVGDVLLMLTDGFKEASSPTGELFGTSRIVSTVAKHQHESAESIFESVRRAAIDFIDGGSQGDDMTGIVAKVLMQK